MSILLFQSEVEETLKRIQSHRGVIGTIVVNMEGMLFNEHQEVLACHTKVHYRGQYLLINMEDILFN